MEINHLEYKTVPEYSALFGCEMEDAELIKMLSGIGCQKAIAILSRFASIHIDVCSQKDEAISLDLRLRWLHLGRIKKLGGAYFRYMNFKISMCLQSIFILEKWVLVYCPQEENLSEITLEDLLIIMDALLVINDKLPKDDVSGHETEYLYLTLYHNTHKIIKNQIARSFYVFSTLAKRDEKINELLEKYKQKKGFSIEDRLAVLFNSLATFDREFTIDDMFTKRPPYVKANNFDAKELTSVYGSIIESVRSNYEEIKERTRKVLDQVWNFEPFYRTPFVKFGDVQIAFSEKAIVYQLWEGLYWDVRYAFKNEGETFMTEFGKPFEHYIQEMTEHAVSESKNKAIFQNEFLYKFKGNNKASTDCYFRIGKTLIAVEAKAKSPHSNTLTGFNREAIITEVKELMIDPVIQVLSRLKEINSKENDIEANILNFFKDIEQIIILSVSMEKVQPIGELLLEAYEEIEDELGGTKVVAYHNVNIEDYEAICNLIEVCSDELPEILIKWFKDQREDIRSAVVLVNFLDTNKKPYVCSKYISDIFDESLKQISVKTFGKDLTSEI